MVDNNKKILESKHGLRIKSTGWMRNMVEKKGKVKDDSTVLS